jgi:phage terminase large subunit-like protein
VRLTLDDSWRGLDEDSKRELAAKLRRLRDTASRAAWQPYPWQRPHEHSARVCDERCFELPTAELDAHAVWLQLGGRGTGKTDAGARHVADHVRGPACDPRLPGGHRVAIVAPTLGDAVESCVNGPSGLSTHAPGVKVWSAPGGTYLRFPEYHEGQGGALAKLFGAHTPDDVERLRAGGNRCLVWWEELAAWRYLAEAMEHSTLGLRLGTTPHIVASTTPKARAPLVKLVDEQRTIVTRGRTKDAHHLDETVRQSYLDKYGGTRSGRQELDGELLRDIEGALWTYAAIDAGRVKTDAVQLAQELAHICVAIDPAVTKTESSDETGIVVVGRTRRDHCPSCGDVTEPHAFVLADVSARYGPDEWAEAAIDVFDMFDADEIVAEVNNGGDMVGFVVRTVRPNVPYREVRATRGKRTRAEPVAALYATATRPTRVHHINSLPELEDQQTTWTPDEDSPDRMDALVWGITRELIKRACGHASVA